MSKKKRNILILDIIFTLFTTILFGIPFLFVILNACKNKTEASWMLLTLPSEFALWANLKEVFSFNDGIVARGFLNSIFLTIVSLVIILPIVAAAGFFIQRRSDNIAKIANSFLLFGLIAPMALVPTIKLMKSINLMNTLLGLILIEVALAIPLATILFRAYIVNIPTEIDDAAVVDGCSPLRLFLQIILPLLKPIIATVSIVFSASIYNDFVNPIYFLSGIKSATVQVSIYYFRGKLMTDWNLVFTDVLVITIPPLLAFIFLNKQIISGMTIGSVKG